VTTPARELWKAMAATDPVGFDRTLFVNSLDPTLAMVAQTLFARTDPMPEDEEDQRQAVEQSLLSLERSRVSELLDYARSELAEAEANADADAIGRLQRDVLDLQAKRLELDRRKETTTVLTTDEPRVPRPPYLQLEEPTDMDSADKQLVAAFSSAASAGATTTTCCSPRTSSTKVPGDGLP
jgi:hypothetical protein